MQDPTATNTGSAKVSHKRKWALGGLIAAGSAALVLSLGAWAGGGPGGTCMHGQGMEGMHMGGGMGGHHGKHGFMFGGRHIERMLDHADATPAQREKIKPLVDKATTDLTALHDEGRALHEQGLKLWAQPKIDAAGAEKLRKQMLAHHDKVSKRMLQAMIDVGNVLTPEQRTKLADHMQKHRHGAHGAQGARHGHGHGHGMMNAASQPAQPPSVPPAAKE